MHEEKKQQLNGICNRICGHGNQSARPVEQPSNHIMSPLYHGLSTGKSSVRDHRGPSAHHSSAVLIILAQFCYNIELTLRPEAILEFYTPTQALTTKRSSKLRRTLTQQLVRVENGVCSRGRAIREHTETLGSFYSLLLASKPVSAERASLKESSATKIVKNEGWKRRKSTVESYGEQ
ncbi:nicotianamine synthase [Dorcoceras hygrometricum]|uniref:Nicotianamine synthase n=1 Tax=Dorcoceras hygrometricum TaxID=472368 RepID=A0A2Z7CEP0_9LAMI|nr:nicotianamine synthase [Dorcoceras hygrometricum]